MNDYYLRIEGVNMNNFVFDTGDLSTIRGGGLLLLEAPAEILKTISGQHGSFTPITEGASWGLYSFQAKNNRQASEIACKVREQLCTDPYRHATFVVEVLPKPGKHDYVERCEELAALSRWRQMQSLSVVVPPPAKEDQWPSIKRDKKEKKIIVCELDHVRPAVVEETKGDDQIGISKSASIRRKYGKEKKSKEWYEKIIGYPLNGRKLKYDFVTDFDELTKTADRKGHEGNKKILNQKMAVIYLDGNHFGHHRSSYCTDESKQKRFDQTIRKEYQNGTLRILLEENEENAEKYNWLVTAKDGTQRMRLETLLWGGDEVIWVAPAWNGWWLLARFFQLVEKNWKFFDGSNLTLSAGLVFCHHNAPIQRIVRLAKSLGDMAKGDRTTNRVAYQVLESFDHAGVDIAAFRNSRCPAGVDPEDLIIDGNAMYDMIQAMKKLKKSIPKRRLHRLVKDLYLGENAAGSQDDLNSQIESGMLDLIKKSFGKAPGCWLHLLELWDFIGMEDQTAEVA